MATQVPLLTAGHFEILAGSGITVAGAVNSTVVVGDIGTNPTPTETGLGNMVLTGVDYTANGPVMVQAKLDLVAAYNNAAGQGPAITIPSQLGGTTLTPGVYTCANGAFLLTGTLILNAQGNPNAVWIFQMASTITTAAASNVVVINGGNPCNVFWQVGSSATMGANSNFAGTVLALTSITMTTSATINGRLLARNGAVTLDTNTCTICNSSALAPGIVGAAGGPCDIGSLAAQGAQFNSVDAITAQALKTYMLAVLLKTTSGGAIDQTNICNLANSLKQFDSLPDYAKRSAELQVYVAALAANGVTFDPVAAKAATACAHCCTTSPQSLKSAEICLLNLII